MKFFAAVLATVVATATEKSPTQKGDICSPKFYEATGATKNALIKTAWETNHIAKATVKQSWALADITKDEKLELRWSADDIVCTTWTWDSAIHNWKANAADTSCDSSNKEKSHTDSLTLTTSWWSGDYKASDTDGETKKVRHTCFTANADISALEDTTVTETRQTYKTGSTTEFDTTLDISYTITKGQLGSSLLLWLFIILLLGGGGGAAYYFMVIAPTM